MLIHGPIPFPAMESARSSPAPSEQPATPASQSFARFLGNNADGSLPDQARGRASGTSAESAAASPEGSMADAGLPDVPPDGVDHERASPARPPASGDAERPDAAAHLPAGTGPRRDVVAREARPVLPLTGVSGLADADVPPDGVDHERASPARPPASGDAERPDAAAHLPAGTGPRRDVVAREARPVLPLTGVSGLADADVPPDGVDQERASPARPPASGDAERPDAAAHLPAGTGPRRDVAGREARPVLPLTGGSGMAGGRLRMQGSVASNGAMQTDAGPRRHGAMAGEARHPETRPDRFPERWHGLAGREGADLRTGSAADPVARRSAVKGPEQGDIASGKHAAQTADGMPPRRGPVHGNMQPGPRIAEQLHQAEGYSVRMTPRPLDRMTAMVARESGTRPAAGAETAAAQPLQASSATAPRRHGDAAGMVGIGTMPDGRALIREALPGSGRLDTPALEPAPPLRETEAVPARSSGHGPRSGTVPEPTSGRGPLATFRPATGTAAAQSFPAVDHAQSAPAPRRHGDAAGVVGVVATPDGRTLPREPLSGSGRPDMPPLQPVASDRTAEAVPASPSGHDPRGSALSERATGQAPLAAFWSPAGAPAQSTPLPAAPLQPAAWQGHAAGVADGRPALSDASLGIQPDDLPPLRSLGSAQPAQGASLSPAEPMPEARQIARQVAEQFVSSVNRTTSGQVTIQMAPAELGRVDISMQPREQGMALLIAAERPETLELLRRHVDLLAEDLRALGWSDLSFQFGAGGQSPEERARGDHASTDPASAPDGHPDGALQDQRAAGAAMRTLSADGRLDLRF